MQIKKQLQWNIETLNGKNAAWGEVPPLPNWNGWLVGCKTCQFMLGYLKLKWVFFFLLAITAFWVAGCGSPL